MDNIGKLYYKSARALGFEPVLLTKEIEGFSFEVCGQIYYFRQGLTPFNNVTAATIAVNKYSTNKLLERAGLPVPKCVGVTYTQYKEHNWRIEQLKFPVVCKPAWNTSCGSNVVCNIKDLEGVKAYFHKNIRKSRCINIEEYHPNLRSYRVLVGFGKVIGLVERTPAHVIGDGASTIRELIKAQNVIREKQHETIPTGSFNLNEETWTIFKERNLTVDSVPKQGEKIPLRYICNSTHGGTFESLDTDFICDENAAIACKAAKVLALNSVGFDIICEDISKPIGDTIGFIIEANTDPDITIHENAINGKAVQVSKILLQRFIKQNKWQYYYQRFINHRILISFLKTASVLVVLGLAVWSVQQYG